jgi:hypothetical protein
MKSSTQRLGFWLVTLLLGAALTASSAFAAKGKTFTGTVSDSMCGAKHEMPGDDAGCTRACVSKGSKYALVVGDKVYTLETNDKTALETLDKQAGAKATVTGHGQWRRTGSQFRQRPEISSSRTSLEAISVFPVQRVPALAGARSVPASVHFFNGYRNSYFLYKPLC